MKEDDRRMMDNLLEKLRSGEDDNRQRRERRRRNQQPLTRDDYPITDVVMTELSAEDLLKNLRAESGAITSL